MIQTLFKFLTDCWNAIIRWFKQQWFELNLQQNLHEEEEKLLEELEQLTLEENKELIKPQYIEYPVDPGLQTGESQLLGGAMELKAPWHQDQ